MRVQLISPQDAVDLRRQVLRPESEFDDGVVYAEDGAATTATYGCFVDDELVSVGTIMEADYPLAPAVGDWRIRGMATADGYRSRGCGQSILEALLRHAKTAGGRRVWCNARSDAVAFYERAGFVRRGDVFLTAGERPHFLMDLGELSTHGGWGSGGS